ncbi:MAG: hypothetical protein PHY43_01145 [Verrucomicrobiales bacterium]|nr:hypothetical protein [Verrucomicrobiales bacterium]
MSLINDALKRAQEAQRPNTSSSVSSLRTIEARPAERPFISRMLAIVIFVLLAAAFAFIGLAMTGRVAKKIAVAPQNSPAHPVQAVAAPVPPVSAAPVVVVAAPVAPVSPAPAPASAPVSPAPVPAAAPVVAAPEAVPAPPPLVLPETLHVQGLAHDAARPWAIVSGRTVYVGDTVRGVQVLEITRDSVTFGSHGQSNLLFLGQ